LARGSAGDLYRLGVIKPHKRWCSILTKNCY